MVIAVRNDTFAILEHIRVAIVTKCATKHASLDFQHVNSAGSPYQASVKYTVFKDITPLLSTKSVLPAALKNWSLFPDLTNVIS